MMKSPLRVVLHARFEIITTPSGSNLAVVLHWRLGAAKEVTARVGVDFFRCCPWLMRRRAPRVARASFLAPPNYNALHGAALHKNPPWAKKKQQWPRLEPSTSNRLT
jgi:hypothetical protein